MTQGRVQLPIGGTIRQKVMDVGSFSSYLTEETENFYIDTNREREREMERERAQVCCE